MGASPIAAGRGGERGGEKKGERGREGEEQVEREGSDKEHGGKGRMRESGRKGGSIEENETGARKV